MKPTPIIVNTARGEVIDENALARMLEAGELAGAGLDVFENEPRSIRSSSSCDNVVLLPHMGSATIEGRIDMGEKVIINIKTFADGHRPPDRVSVRCEYVLDPGLKRRCAAQHRAKDFSKILSAQP
jgi:glyoxylate reductase